MNTTSRIVLSIAFASSLAACASGGNGYRDSGYRDSGYNRGYAARNEVCNNCGVVQRIDIERYGDGRASGGGAVAGALIGAAVGNQVGSGDGRKAATVAGAIAGGVAGNNIEKNRNSRDTYEVVVRLDSGRTIVLEQRDLNGIREGSRVVVNSGTARLM
jgi:outer membrane lipoprotein SlyB